MWLASSGTVVIPTAFSHILDSIILGLRKQTQSELRTRNPARHNIRHRSMPATEHPRRSFIQRCSGQKLHKTTQTHNDRAQARRIQRVTERELAHRVRQQPV
jgi:hypothetical protein